MLPISPTNRLEGYGNRSSDAGYTNSQHRNLPPIVDRPFDYTFLMDWYIKNSYKYPRNKISNEIKKGNLLALKRGLYCVSPRVGGRMEAVIAAGVLYFPSYISFQYALSHWGLIPERVEVITSATTRRSKRFSTPLGLYTYTHIDNAVFPYGVITEKFGELKFLIANREKAITDMVHTVREVTRVGEIESLLFDDLRIDESSFIDLDPAQLLEYANLYNSQSTRALSRWLKRRLL